MSNQLTDGGRGEGVLVVKANLMMLDRGVHFNLYTGAVHTSRYNSVITTKYSQRAMTVSSHTLHHDGKISPAGEGGGCTPNPYITIFTIMNKVAVYAQAENADKPPSLFHLCPYVLCGFYISQSLKKSLTITKMGSSNTT